MAGEKQATEEKKTNRDIMQTKGKGASRHWCGKGKKRQKAMVTP